MGVFLGSVGKMQYFLGFVFVLSSYIFSLQILTSVPLMSITVMQMLSVIILRDLTTAHVALDIERFHSRGQHLC